MNRSRKKENSYGTLKRLARESMVLSATRFVSSRLNRLFSSGFASPLFASAEKVDDFASKKITAPINKKLDIRKKFAMPARNAVASFFSRNAIMKWLAAFKTAFLNTSLRSVGIFLLTFGIYAAAIFLLKSYVSLTIGVANPDDLSVAAVTFIVGLLLTAFGEKSILSALGNGRITGALLSGCLGVNDSSIDRAKNGSSGTAVGISFLLGSLLGVLTLFFTPASVLFIFLSILVFVAILNVPEFGLLLSVATVSFVHVGYLAVIAGVTLVSYLLKCLVLKRNLRFGSADAAMLLAYVVLFVACAASNGGFDRGELYLLAFVSLYFPAKNLICSRKLIYQTFNALCLGLFVGMSLYLLDEYSEFISHSQLRMAAQWLTRYTLSADMLTVLASATLPFAFYSLLFGKKRGMLMTLLLSIACAVITDSFWFYALIMIALFIFVAFAYKAPAGATLGAAVLLPPAFVFASDYTNSAAVSIGIEASYDSAFVFSGGVVSFWGGVMDIGGILVLITLALALVLVIQRTFSGMLMNTAKGIVAVNGTVAASAVVMIICSFIFNPFSDIRIIGIMWFVFGICGSVYKLNSRS
ncbi:MAG: hypothetical protein IJO64_03320 [Clostridia bacterium]|nr:hypothetical protein [Clostridia bacterium]